MSCFYYLGIFLYENHLLNYYEQTVFLYAKGYFEFKKNLDTGVEKMKQAIQVFDILEEQNMKSQYIDHFSQNVEIR